MDDIVNTKFGYIYKITNLVNGKIYVGKKKGSFVDENYWGSGSKIKVALREFGTSNFRREILEWCSTNDILKAREKYWIETLHARDSSIGYNVKQGGEGDRQSLPDEYKQQKDLKIIGFQLPDNLRKQLEAEAEYLSISISAMVRLILAQRYRDAAKLNDVEED